MNCLLCKTPNDEGAKFCKNCGSILNLSDSNNLHEKNMYEYLNIITVSFISFLSLLATSQKMLHTKYGDLFIQIYIVCLQFTPIIMALYIKNKTAKILLIFLSILSAIFSLYYFFLRFLHI
jgi:hypothetical protein